MHLSSHIKANELGSLVMYRKVGGWPSMAPVAAGIDG